MSFAKSYISKYVTTRYDKNFSEKEIFVGYQVVKLDCPSIVYDANEFLNVLKKGFDFVRSFHSF